MLTPEQLTQVQRSLQATAQQLSDIFAQASLEQSNAYFEEIGAARYYLGEAENCLESVIQQLQSPTDATHE